MMRTTSNEIGWQRAFRQIARDVSTERLVTLQQECSLDPPPGALYKGRWLGRHAKYDTDNAFAFCPLALLKREDSDSATRLEYRLNLWHNQSREVRCFVAWWDEGLIVNRMAELRGLLTEIIHERKRTGHYDSRSEAADG